MANPVVLEGHKSRPYRVLAQEQKIDFAPLLAAFQDEQEIEFLRKAYRFSGEHGLSALKRNTKFA